MVDAGPGDVRGWITAGLLVDEPALVVLTLSLLGLVGLLTVQFKQRQGSPDVESSTLEPYPGYFQRHGRSAMMKSAKHGCRGLSAQELGTNGVVIIDVNNVRGKFGFRRANMIAFCGCVTRWASVNGLAGQILLAVDHGPRQAAVSVADTMFCFAGPRYEADDTIVFDIDWFLRNEHVPIVVVTADRDLKRRCRGVFNTYLARQTNATDSDQRTLRIVDSGAFAGWVSRSGWPEYQMNCCADGLCSCTAPGADADAVHGQRQRIRRSAGPERTVDRMKLAHHAFDVVRSVSAGNSRQVWSSGTKPASRWHDGYAAWVGGGRKT